MDARQLFSDPELKTEFLDRFDDLVTSHPVGTGAMESMGGGLEGLEGGLRVDDAAATIAEMEEGVWTPGNAGLEAIIERFTRPVYLVQDSDFGEPPDDFEDSDLIADRLDNARDLIKPAIPSVGRIDLRNHPKPWVGTGWVVGSEVVATNRHVANEFARPGGDGFVYRKNFFGQEQKATLDWYHEYQRPDESRFRVKEILWIEPDESFDVALLRITDLGEDDEVQPAALDLAAGSDVEIDVGTWIGVIGYPARSPFNDPADQQRIFDGIYDVKRLAPGQITAIRDDGLFEHDATSLGGCSGSAVVDLATGKVAGIHFGGIEGQENYAVQATRLAEIVQERIA